MNIGTEGRIFERIEGSFTVRYSLLGNEEEFCATTKNISGGGIRVTLVKKLAPGTELDLEIARYTKGIKTRCKGKVVWIWDEPMNGNHREHFEVGIQFINTRLLSIGRLINSLEDQIKIT